MNIDRLVHDENIFIGQIYELIKRDPTGVKCREKAIDLLNTNQWQTARDVPADRRSEFLCELSKVADNQLKDNK